MGFFDNIFSDPNEDFGARAKRFGKGKKPTTFFNDEFDGKDEDGNKVKTSNKRVDFNDGSFIEEIRDGEEVKQMALEIKPHKHKPPKVKNPDDEPMDFFNY